MKTQRTASECRDIVIALLRQHGALTQQEVIRAAALDKHEVRLAITAMRRTELIRRIASLDDNGAAGRYDLTGKTPGRHKTTTPPSPFTEACFDGLLGAWRIAPPREPKTSCSSRVIRCGNMKPPGYWKAEDWDDMLADIWATRDWSNCV